MAESALEASSPARRLEGGSMWTQLTAAGAIGTARRPSRIVFMEISPKSPRE
ncbi:MAG: hypothetical protein ACREFP_24365 [Acetobacteraceae bacterium]